MDGLAVLRELSCLHKRMRECISLSPLWIDVDDCAGSRGPCSCLHELLMLLINTVGTKWGWWNPVSSWRKRRFLGEATLKRTLRQLFPDWQGVWRDLSRFLGQVSPPRAWDFTPEQATTLETGVSLAEGCLALPQGSSFCPVLGSGLCLPSLSSVLRGLGLRWDSNNSSSYRNCPRSEKEMGQRKRWVHSIDQ